MMTSCWDVLSDGCLRAQLRKYCVQQHWDGIVSPNVCLNGSDSSPDVWVSQVFIDVDLFTAVVFGVEQGSSSLWLGVFYVGRCGMKPPSMSVSPSCGLLDVVWEKFVFLDGHSGAHGLDCGKVNKDGIPGGAVDAVVDVVLVSFL